MQNEWQIEVGLETGGRHTKWKNSKVAEGFSVGLFDKTSDDPNEGIDGRTPLEKEKMNNDVIFTYRLISLS